MSELRILALCAFALVPVLSLAQIKGEFVGKWVVDRDRMLEVDPAWDGVLTDEMWIMTGFRDGLFFLSRSRDDTESYDPTGAPTRVSIGGDEAIAKAQWEGDRLVVHLTVSAAGRSFTRTIYREGHWLVVEDQERADARWQRTFFVKS